MVADLYSTTRPSSLYRALFSSLALLAIVSTLAASMTWKRGREPLASRITPPGWAISFRPPKGFNPGEVARTSLGPVIPFFGRTTDANEVVLLIRRFYVSSEEDAAIVGEHLIREQVWGPPSGGWWSLSPPLETRLGPFAAVELQAPEASTIARTAVLGSGVGYAVVMTVSGAPLDDIAYDIFDHTCRSIEAVDR